LYKEFARLKIKESNLMKPYQYYNLPSYFPYQEQFDPNRQNPPDGSLKDIQQTKELQRLNKELTRQNQEIHRLNSKISRINHEVLRLNKTNELQTQHLTAISQRLRMIENRLNIHPGHS
ncbi:MAG: hypothetical protein Q8934_22690, partial [Bacillota bacterium]|nr:hypothetical protein [Bacillota bacterium]